MRTGAMWLDSAEVGRMRQALMEQRLQKYLLAHALDLLDKEYLRETG
jgi:hypothetical protein